MKNSISAVLMFILLPLVTAAQDSQPEIESAIEVEAHAGSRFKTDLFSLKTMVRMDFQRLYVSGIPSRSHSGFTGKYFMFRADGEIIPGLKYSWRQRLNKPQHDGSFFDATDWLYVDYRYRSFSYCAGKQVACFGTWEYDRFPLDLYITSLLWRELPSFVFAVSSTWHVTHGNAITLQLSESPFAAKGNRDIYAYNMQWLGETPYYDALWSVNMVEYQQGKYINYIALGNRVRFSDQWRIEADVMNRAASHQTFLLKDITALAELRYSPSERWNLFTKYIYDFNGTNSSADKLVPMGTELSTAGIAAEFYPLKKAKTNLRLHLAAQYSWGKNNCEDDLLPPKSLLFNVGVTWNLNLLSLRN